MTDLRIAVIGDKDFDNYAQMESVLNAFIGIHKEKTISIVSGGNDGAHSSAKRYASEKGLKFDCYPADTDRYGKVAGFIRNKELIGAADRVIAFWKGRSGETKNAIEEAERLDIPSYSVTP